MHSAQPMSLSAAFQPGRRFHVAQGFSGMSPIPHDVEASIQMLCSTDQRGIKLHEVLGRKDIMPP